MPQIPSTLFYIEFLCVIISFLILIKIKGFITEMSKMVTRKLFKTNKKKTVTFITQQSIPTPCSFLILYGMTKSKLSCQNARYFSRHKPS